MSAKRNGISRGQKVKHFQGEGPNWILIVGGALLSTLSVRLGYKLKQALDSKQQANATSSLKMNGTSGGRRSPGCSLHSSASSYTRNDDCCFSCSPGAGAMEANHSSNGQIASESNTVLPLVTVPPPEYNKENSAIWASSPDRLELPLKPFHHHSTCSDSPCVSESGSDIFSKREVIQKLRQQLRRRDEMILEMQDQIVDLQNSLNAQMAHSKHLQVQLDNASRDLFDSETEVQKLRKAIAEHCVGQTGSNGRASPVTAWNGHANGYIDGDGERIVMLKKEVGELREVIEGKEYLLQSYKEQKAELSSKIKELQLRLDSQLPHIL